MKYCFLLRWADLEALMSTSVRQRLWQAGATRVQFNIDDATVAPAMRISNAEPVQAVVSVWTAGDVAPVTGILVAVTDHLSGYAVTEERQPLPPTPAPDGVRTDALANVAVLRRPADLTETTWRQRWLDEHTQVAIDTQGTFAYVQNVVGAPVTPDAEPVAAIVEEHFPMAAMSDIHAFYGSGGDEAELNDRITRLMASCARFGADRDLDLVPTSRFDYSRP